MRVFFGPHDIVSPDLVGWRRERVPAFPDEQPLSIRPGAWSEGDQARIPPFDALEIEVGELFPPVAEVAASLD